jgi:hypothetical protein
MGLNSSYSCWKNLRNIDILLPHYKSPIRHSANTLVHNHNTYYTTKFLQSGTPGNVELEESGPKAKDLPVVTSGVNTDFVHLSCYPDFIESTQPSKRLQKIQRWVNKVQLETDHFKRFLKNLKQSGGPQVPKRCYSLLQLCIVNYLRYNEIGGSIHVASNGSEKGFFKWQTHWKSLN